MSATSEDDPLEGLIDEFARVVWDAEQARVLVRRAGFPPGDLPAFNTARRFWSLVVWAADDGKILGGVQALVEAAAKQYPGNEFFTNYPASAATPTGDPSPKLKPGQQQPTNQPDIALPEDRARPYQPKIARRVTQRDRDLFTRSTFETIHDYFRRGLSALEGGDTGIETDLERVSTREIRARIYRDGDVAAQCQIFLDAHGMKNSIGAYWGAQLGSGNALNGWLSIHNDETPLGWSAEMVDLGTHASSQKLNQDTAAEQLWRRFVAPLERQPR